MQLNRAFAREAQSYPYERDCRSMGQSKGYCPPSKSTCSTCVEFYAPAARNH